MGNLKEASSSSVSIPSIAHTLLSKKKRAPSRRNAAKEKSKYKMQNRGEANPQILKMATGVGSVVQSFS